MNAAQRALHAALREASTNQTIQLGLIYVYANRLGTPEKDVKAVRALIVGGTVRVCEG